MRLGLAAFAVVLATVLVPIGITSTWLSLRVDNTDAYVDTVAPLADEPALRKELGEELAAAAISAMESSVPVGLPAAFSEGVRRATTMVVESKAFPDFWRQANADAHREFLAIVHERGQEVDDDGYVIVDLQPLLQQVIDEIARTFPPAALVEAPPLPLPVLPESELERARGAYQVLEGLAFWVPLFWLGLVLVAVIATPGMRGRMRAAGAAAIGAAIGGGLVLAVTPALTDAVVDQVDPAKQDLARLVVEVVVSTLDESAWAGVIGGLVVAALFIGASLVPGGRTRSHGATVRS
ncbi:hypothetical protein [Nocardioides stalactiti]|uniref:hypothetical protein n=1 Tax=Nocardioides stalactiti TaxID=2755356 RepID=UPI00160204EF|nr:hypothetical protein [Nocardioides stalactiti]